MAVSSTTFSERITRINSGATTQATSLPPLPRGKKPKSRRMATLLKWGITLCVLGGIGYGWQTGQISVGKIVALASSYV